jgi:SulP family sulfate permease
VLKLRGYPFFGTATQLTRRVREHAIDRGSDRLKYVLLDFAQVSGIDSSATYAFHRMRDLARQKGLTLILTGLTPELYDRLHVGQLVEEDQQVSKFADLDHCLEWCENQMLESTGRNRTRVSQTILQRLASHFGDDATAAEFLRYLTEVSFSEGRRLIEQGDTSGDLHFLEEGEVSVYLQPSEGDAVRIRRTGSGTILGELGFHLGTPRSASVVAKRDGKAYRLSAVALEKMERERPDFTAVLHRFIADLLAERLLHTTRTLEALMD